MNYYNIMLILLLLLLVIISIFIIVINIFANTIKSKEYLIVLFIISFITVSVFYIMNIMAIYKIPLVEDFSVLVGGSNCRDYLITYPSNPNIKTTYDNLKKDEIGKITGNYHTDYTCENNFSKGITGGKYSSGRMNTYDINTREMLLAYMCINKSPRDLKKDLGTLHTSEVKSFVLLSKNNFKKYNGKFDSGGHDKLISNIATEIRREIEPNMEKVYGPVYICLSQAPYIYEKNKNLTINFSIIKHGKSCNEDEVECNRHLYLEYLLIYPNKYKMNGDKNVEKFISIIKNLKSNSPLCWLNCNMDKNYGCGCLSYDGENNTDVDYKSKCTPSDNEKKIRADIKDYSIIYFINPYAKNRSDLIDGWHI